MLCGYRQFPCIHKADDIYKDIEEDVETSFDPSNYKLNRSVPKQKKKKEEWKIGGKM